MVEKKILYNSGCIEQVCGTSKYNVQWQGDWTDTELINYCDGGRYNFGGRVNRFKREDGTYQGEVCVYYD